MSKMSKAIDGQAIGHAGGTSRKIKRLAVIVVEYPKATETFILRDLMVFHRAGVEVDLHHLSPFGTDVLHGFAAWAYLSRPKWMFKTLGLIPKALAIGEHAKRNGVEHVHGEFAGHPGATGWIINRFFGIPYSVSCRAHDIFRTQALLDRKLGEAAFVRTISAFNKDFLLKKVPGLQADNIHVIHSSVDLNAIAALDPPSNDPFTIVYVGSLQIRKGVDVLLNALAQASDALGDWRCEIIGSGPLEDELKQMAATLNLDRVTFRGQLRPGQTGWLTEAGNVDQFAAALLDIKNDPARAYEMAKAGRQVVAEEFDVNANAMTQIKLFSAHLAS